MNGEYKKRISELVPHMRNLPRRLHALLAQALQVQRAYHAESADVDVTTYIENLERELDQLIYDARQIAHIGGMIQSLTKEPDQLSEVYDIIRESFPEKKRRG